MRWSRAALALTLAVGVAGTADADLIAGDSFIVGPGGYTDGALTPQNPSVYGFTGTWQEGTTPVGNFFVDSLGLDHPVHPSESGGSLHYFENVFGEPQRAYRALDSYPAPGGSVVYYMSGLLQVEHIASPVGIALMGFTNKQDELTDAEFFDPTNDHGIQGLQWGFLGDRDRLDLVLRHRQDGASGICQYTDPLVDDVPTGQIHFVVLKLEMDVGSAPNNDHVSVWVNPTSVAGEGTAGTPTKEFWDCSLDEPAAIDFLVVAKNPLPNTWRFDEPRFGTTWEAVVGAAPIPEPPVADPNGPYSILLGERVQLDGSGSSDPDGAIVSWDWLVNGGSAGSGVSLELTWPNLQALGVTGCGVYDVELTVTDDQDLSHSAATTLTVVPEPTTLGLLALGGLGLLRRRRKK